MGEDGEGYAGSVEGYVSESMGCHAGEAFCGAGGFVRRVAYAVLHAVSLRLGVFDGMSLRG